MNKRLRKIIFGVTLTLALGVWQRQSAFTYAAQVPQEQMWEMFSEEDIAFLNQARTELKTIVDEKDVMALIYLTDYYELRQEPTEEAEGILWLSGGQQVLIKDVILTPQLKVWAEVTCNVKGKSYTGYVNRENLACSDEVFLDWEMEYGMNPALYRTMTMTLEETDGTNEFDQLEELDEPEVEEGQVLHPDIELFPESYQDAL